jgi:dipeptidyl-peptidase-4
MARARRARFGLAIVSLGTLTSAVACGVLVPPPAPVATCASASTSASTSTPRPVDWAAARALAETRYYRNGTPKGVSITPDDAFVLYLESGARDRKQSLYEWDVLAGKSRTIIAADALVKGDEALSPEERSKRERMRITTTGVTQYELSADGATILTQLMGEVIVVDRKSAALRKLPGAEGAYDPHLSPDAKWVAFAKKGELAVAPLDGGPATVLTAGAADDLTHGVGDFIAAEELERARGFWWSPESDRLLFEEVDSRGVEHATVSDPAHPEGGATRVAYPRAGTANAKLRFGIVSVPSAKAGKLAKPPTPTWVKLDEKWAYVAQVVWSKGQGPLLVALDRAQQNLALLAVDPKTGNTSTLLTEHDDQFIEVDDTSPHVLSTGEFLWSSEQGGNWSVELRDPKGARVRTLLPANAGYAGIVDVDEAQKRVTFQSAPTPSRMGLLRVPLAGGAVEKIEGLAPVTTITTGRGHKLWATYEASLAGRRWALRKPDASVVAELPAVVESPSKKPDLELVSLGADEMAAMIIRPHDAPRGRLPVIDAAYGGPHARVVIEDESTYFDEQFLADATGAVVVAIDAKGTPFRGHTWSRAIHRAFGEAPLDGHVKALDALFARDSRLARGRVGAFGWSFGGYFAADAVLRRPDVYTTAVAGAPVTDWLLYDTAYTERYLGDPSRDAAAYLSSSLLPLAARPIDAANPARPLLLLHGTADDNVIFAHSLKLAGALTLSHRPYRFMPIAGATHLVAKPDELEAVFRAVVEHFRQTL